VWVDALGVPVAGLTPYSGSSPAYQDSAGVIWFLDPENLGVGLWTGGGGYTGGTIEYFGAAGCAGTAYLNLPPPRVALTWKGATVYRPVSAPFVSFVPASFRNWGAGGACTAFAAGTTLRLMDASLLLPTVPHAEVLAEVRGRFAPPLSMSWR
jgi:hypothetical protein